MSAARDIIGRGKAEGKKKHPSWVLLRLEVRRVDGFGKVLPVAVGDGLVEFPPPLGGALAAFAPPGAFAVEEMLFDDFDHIAFPPSSRRLLAVLPVLEAHNYRSEILGRKSHNQESVSNAYSGFFAFNPARSELRPCFFSSS